MLGAKFERDDLLSPVDVFLERLLACLHEIPEEDRRLLVVIAGHNGAGKTTIYHERISKALAGFLAEHINPDVIERAITRDLRKQGLSKKELEQLASEEAARLRQQYLDQEINFSFETVLSDPVQDKVQFMAKAIQRSYMVVLMGVGLDSIEKSKERVAIRHSKGGHNVDEDKIEGRYERVLLNFAHGARVATLSIFFDNSEDRGEDGLDTYWDIAFFENGKLVVRDESTPGWWQRVESTFNLLQASKM